MEEIKISNVLLFATKYVGDIIFKIYKVFFQSGVTFSYLMRDDLFIFQFSNDIELCEIIDKYGFSYENK